MNRGCFITFEGIDGSGKSTQINLLEKKLRDSGYDVLLSREPGGTDIGEKIRELILDPANDEMDQLTEAYLYASSRAQLVKQVIIPALDDGKVVICDRFVDSSIAYQGYGRQMGEIIEQLNRFAVDGCLPDITFLLRIEPKGTKSRMAGRELDRIELASENFHYRTFKGYDEIATKNPGRITVIDGRNSVDEIHEAIIAKLAEFDIFKGLQV
ncbi:MAG: dTMP kinase [Bacillota bacterium]|nr:dTMP kinase [Bacillota bacterium]